MLYFDAEEILLIHHQLIERYGGSHGTHDIARVKSAAVAPAQEVFGREQYPDIFEKSAVYARNIITDHPFIDGNKRTGMSVAVLFLKRNGHVFTAKKGELEDFAVKTAADKLDIPTIAAWLRRHCQQTKNSS